jgi:hypothetical protein
MIPPGIAPATFGMVVQCLNQLCLHVQEIKHKLFFFSNLFNQRCQTSAILKFNTNLYDSYGKAMFNTQAACFYRLLTTDRVLDVIRPFILLLRHGNNLVKNIKSIR